MKQKKTRLSLVLVGLFSDSLLMKSFLKEKQYTYTDGCIAVYIVNKGRDLKKFEFKELKDQKEGKR